MHYAILSDVHGNVEAFRAVVADAEKRGVEKIVCLGDLVGFGPDPAACVDLAREKCGMILQGCHDHALLEGAGHLPPPTRATIDWAKEQLAADPALADARLGTLREASTRYEAGGISFMHASPHDPVHEYLFAEDVRRDPRKLARAFAGFEKIAFVGHTHTPGIFLENPIRWTGAAQLENYFHYKRGEKVIVNVGSVGLPRDGDARACYLEVSKNELYWRRIEYDLDGVVAKIEQNERLTRSVAERLRRGI